MFQKMGNTICLIRFPSAAGINPQTNLIQSKVAMNLQQSTSAKLQNGKNTLIRDNAYRGSRKTVVFGSNAKTIVQCGNSSFWCIVQSLLVGGKPGGQTPSHSRSDPLNIRKHY